jgi:hypothetical protein
MDVQSTTSVWPLNLWPLNLSSSTQLYNTDFTSPSTSFRASAAHIMSPYLPFTVIVAGTFALIMRVLKKVLRSLA